MVARIGKVLAATALLLSASPHWPTFAESNPCAQQQQSTCLGTAERAVVELIEKAAPSVVQITALAGLNDRTRFTISLGSGFAWDSKRPIVTNEDVVRGAEAISISLAAGQQLDVEIVGLAPNYDLAVLRLKQAQELPVPIQRGRSDELKAGQFVYAIGNPFGLDQSLTTGVISALRRQLPTGKGRGGAPKAAGARLSYR